MNRMNKVIIVLAMLFALIPSQVVYGDTMEEYLNNLVGPKKQYNTEFSPVYLRSNASEENISSASGDLTLAQTDFYLPGKNGLDLEIKRIYKSGISNVQEMRVKYVNGTWVDYIHSDETTSSFFEDRYNIGLGMRFSFPMMEIRENEDGSSYKFLHTESGDTYRLTEVNVFKDLSPIIDSNATVDSSTKILKQIVNGEFKGKEVYYVEGQTVIDAIVVQSTEFNNGQTGGTSKYKMIDKAGKKTYFAEDGRVLGIVDRYGNTIKFGYSSQKYTVNGTSREKKLISKITDTVGRVVTFNYNEDYSFKVKPIKTTVYNQEESWKESQNPNTVYSGDLEGKFQVVVNLPGGKKIKYDKSAVLVSNSTQQVIRTRLQRVYDVDGLIKYHYWYEQPELGFTYNNGKTYSVFNRYENITQINYLKENKLIKYVYTTHTKKLSDKGSMQHRKVFEKQEIAKTGYDAAKPNFIDRYAGKTMNKTNYTYTNAPDGFGFQGYKEYDYEYLKDTYRFYSEKAELGGAKIKYTYNGLYELVNQEEYGNDHKEIITTEYDEMKLPKKTERIVYSVLNGQAMGEPVKKIENFRYDAFGNLTNYTGPLAPRDSNGYPPADSEHMVVYSYDINRFHVPASKTWNKNSDTKCQITYTIDDRGNTIQESKLHAEDGSLKPAVTDYQYDGFGNMIRKTVNSPDNIYTTYYEYGTDKDGTDHKGAYLTREYSILNGAEISKHYVYDFLTGDVKAEIDQNGNRTSHEYDIFHRPVKAENPDGGTILYKYIESWNQDRKREITDPNGTVSSYSYDTTGESIGVQRF